MHDHIMRRTRQPNSAEAASRTAETLAHYRAEYRRLQRLAARESGTGTTFLGLVHWFSAQHGRWAPATIRAHAAALAQAVRDAAAAGRLDAYANITLRAALDARPTPRLSGPKVGATRKRKSARQSEIVAVRAVLLRGRHPDDAGLARLVLHGSLLGLRPSEWAGAALRGHELHVLNAKATNFRGCGRVRVLQLGDCYAAAGARADLARLIEDMRRRLAITPGDDGRVVHRRVLGRLAARLRRACAAADVRPISLYTLRHVGIATAKTSMPAAHVAALAGHASDRTASTHYAKSRSGWRLPTPPAVPSAETIARVRITGRDRRAAPRATVERPQLR